MASCFAKDSSVGCVHEWARWWSKCSVFLDLIPRSHEFLLVTHLTQKSHPFRGVAKNYSILLSFLLSLSQEIGKGSKFRPSKSWRLVATTRDLPKNLFLGLGLFSAGWKYSIPLLQIWKHVPIWWSSFFCPSSGPVVWLADRATPRITGYMIIGVTREDGVFFCSFFILVWARRRWKMKRTL